MDALEKSMRHWDDCLAGGVDSIGEDRNLSGVFLVCSDSAKPGSSKFILQAWGISIPEIGSLEEQMENDHGDWLELAEGRNWCRLTGWIAGEIQYGQGYGDTFRIPGYYTYERITCREARAEIEAWLVRELERVRTKEPLS